MACCVPPTLSRPQFPPLWEIDSLFCLKISQNQCEWMEGVVDSPVEIWPLVLPVFCEADSQLSQDAALRTYMKRLNDIRPIMFTGDRGWPGVSRLKLSFLEQGHLSSEWKRSERMLGPGDRHEVGNIICSSHNKGDLLQQWVAKKRGNGHAPLALWSFSDSVPSVFHAQKSSYSDVDFWLWRTINRVLSQILMMV